MKTVLIADDNAASRELLQSALEPLGFRVIEAADGEEALTLIESDSPDLILLDIQMPLLNGFAVLEAVRKERSHSGTRLIAITALAMESDRERILAAGFDSYISKPISISALRKQLEQWLYEDERANRAES